MPGYLLKVHTVEYFAKEVMIEAKTEEVLSAQIIKLETN
jgi:hypothetical protein